MCVAHVKVELAIPCRLGVCKGYILLFTILLLQGNSLVQQFHFVSLPRSLSSHFITMQLNQNCGFSIVVVVVVAAVIELCTSAQGRVFGKVQGRKGLRRWEGRKSLSGRGECVREQTHSKLELDNGKQSKQMPLKYKHTRTHTHTNTSTHSHIHTHTHTHTQSRTHTHIHTLPNT